MGTAQQAAMFVSSAVISPLVRLVSPAKSTPAIAKASTRVMAEPVPRNLKDKLSAVALNGNNMSGTSMNKLVILIIVLTFLHSFRAINLVGFSKNA
jgi:hypothetical protein